MDVEQFKEDVREGRIDVDRVVELVVTLQRELQAAKQRIEELERKLGGLSTAKVDEPFSVREEEKRQEARGKKRRKRNRPARRGRISTADKIALAVRTEKVFPAGVPESDCKLSHTRPVWRLENGQAVLVAYEIHRGPKSQFGKIPGVMGRSEFGIEIVVAIAYLVYVVGLSFDKVCLPLNFFQNLKLRKSQVDALLNQLSRHWESEFDILCTLLATSAIVHADETSWSLNSVWAFLSEKVRVLFFGVHKDANAEYRRLADGLLEIYRAACRVQRDRRLSDAGRKQKVGELDDRILDLCGPVWFAELAPQEGPDNDYRLLCNEMMRLMLAEQLFVFVTAQPVTTPRGETMPVAGTNNEAERTLRGPASARDTGRTNKTVRGARRQTVITSVLESLRQCLSSFTLATVVAEIQRWSARGHSCFMEQLDQLQRSSKGKFRQRSADKSLLDALLPIPAD